MESLGSCGRAGTVLLAAALAAPALAQTTWFVDGSAQGPGTGTRLDPYSSIQYALHHPATQPGDVILVGPGVYCENLSVDRFGVVLRSTLGAEQTLIQARGKGSTLLVRHADLEHATVIAGFTFMGGSGSECELGPVGGGVFLDATDATLVDCVVSANRALRGGGIGVVRARLDAQGLEVWGNVAERAPRTKDGHGGGLFLKESSRSTLVDCVFRGNLAGRGGGIYSLDSRIDLEVVLLEENHVSQGDFLDECGQGGGLYAFLGSVHLTDCDFVRNLARGSGNTGGGARLINTRATIRGGAFRDNAVGAFWPDTWLFSGAGGGLATECDATVEGTLFEGNRAPDSGGAIYGRGTFRSCILRGNGARFGGGAWTGPHFVVNNPAGCFYGALRLERCEIEGNVAVGGSAAAGGGVYGPAYLERCRLAGNGARGNGGGAAHATLVDCVLEGNTAASADLCQCTFGGGAYECYLEGCTVRRNQALGVGKAVGYGGGLYGGSAERTVFEGNRADFGGGVAQDSLQRLEHLTLWDNRATYGGGGVFFMSPGLLRNSIVWDNAPDCIGGATQRAIVTYSDVEGGCPGLGNEDIDPCFWAPELGDFHLIAGSPCIDTGDPLSPPDPDGSPPDKGAVPFAPDWCGSPVAFCQAKPNSAGCTPSIHWRGTPSQSGPDDFVVGAVQVLGGQNGILLLARGPAELPLGGGGMLCLARPIHNVALAVSGGNPSGLDCSGTFAFPLSQALLGAHGLTAGQTGFVQILYRDNGAPPPLKLGLTDALRFTVCP